MPGCGGCPECCTPTRRRWQFTKHCLRHLQKLLLVKLGDSGDVAFVKVPLFYLAVGRIAVHCFFGSGPGRMDRICYRETDLYNGREKGRLKGVRYGFSKNAPAAVEAK